MQLGSDIEAKIRAYPHPLYIVAWLGIECIWLEIRDTETDGDKFKELTRYEFPGIFDYSDLPNVRWVQIDYSRNPRWVPFC